MRKFIYSTLLTLAVLVSNVPAQAALSPISINILPPIQFPPEEFSVTGLRTSLLWGEQRDLYGVDLGLLGNVTNVSYVGVAVSGIFNLTRGSTTIIGLQAAGITNVNIQKTDVYGVQVALAVNSNNASSSVSGLQLAALANLSEFTNIYGVQAGLYNIAQEVYGLQIGLVNVTTNLHGLQIGLINFNHKGTFSVSPIINVGF